MRSGAPPPPPPCDHPALGLRLQRNLFRTPGANYCRQMWCSTHGGLLSLDSKRSHSGTERALRCLALDLLCSGYDGRTSVGSIFETACDCRTS